MKRARFTEEQIIGILRENEAGAKAGELARKHGVSEGTIYACPGFLGHPETEAPHLGCHILVLEPPCGIFRLNCLVVAIPPAVRYRALAFALNFPVFTMPCFLLLNLRGAFCVPFLACLRARASPAPGAAHVLTL